MSRFLRLLPYLKKSPLLVGISQEKLPGSHLSPIRGVEEERFEYRPYTPGEDIRYMDWYSYARWEKLYLRYGIQKSRDKYFFWLDSSLSMQIYSEKFFPALLSFLSFIYLALQNRDKIYALLHREVYEIKNIEDILKLEEKGEKIFSSSDNLPPEEEIPYFPLKGGKIFFFSDLYIPLSSWEEILKKSQKSHNTFFLIHAILPKEWDIPSYPFLSLEDIETQETFSTGEIPYYEIWQKAIERRKKLLYAYQGIYIPFPTEKGPLFLLYQYKSLRSLWSGKTPLFSF